MNRYGDPAGARVSLIFIPGAFAPRLIYDAAAAAKARREDRTSRVVEQIGVRHPILLCRQLRRLKILNEHWSPSCAKLRMGLDYAACIHKLIEGWILRSSRLKLGMKIPIVSWLKHEKKYKS
jgi:hypothetical protein